MIGELLREPQQAELALSNARAELTEAATIIRQYLPEVCDDENDQEQVRIWFKQLAKIKQALGLIGNVREMVAHDDRFTVLQPKRRSNERRCP